MGANVLSRPQTQRDAVRMSAQIKGSPFDAVRRSQTPKRLLKFPDTEGRWFKSRIAHACPPTLAQGGAQALEDAAVLTELSPEGAREHIFGYTVLNDWSARDLQRREMKVMLGPAKGKDFATTLGPWLVTADELEPYRDAEGFLALDLRASVNGELIGQDLLSSMGWPFEELIAYAARGTEVRAGDVLGSGTCGSGGCLAELWGRHGRTDPPPLHFGDVVELSVEGIGTVRNRVIPGLTLPPVRAARPRPVPREHKRPPSRVPPATASPRPSA
jgi:hypothetical protein